jgi:hypothetical protein
LGAHRWPAVPVRASKLATSPRYHPRGLAASLPPACRAMRRTSAKAPTDEGETKEDDGRDRRDAGRGETISPSRGRSPLKQSLLNVLAALAVVLFMSAVLFRGAGPGVLANDQILGAVGQTTRITRQGQASVFSSEGLGGQRRSQASSGSSEPNSRASELADLLYSIFLHGAGGAGAGGGTGGKG